MTARAEGIAKIPETKAKPMTKANTETHTDLLRKMLDGRLKQLSSCERMLELLQPEWDKFEARTGHDIYVARDYADHTSAARKHRKEIAALEYVLTQPSRDDTPPSELVAEIMRLVRGAVNDLDDIEVVAREIALIDQPPEQADQQDEIDRLPRLDAGLIEAAMIGHYGDHGHSIDGAVLTVKDRDWSFREGFKRMWAGVRKELARRAALNGSQSNAE